jgi:hypothetical protein
MCCFAHLASSISDEKFFSPKAKPPLPRVDKLGDAWMPAAMTCGRSPRRAANDYTQAADVGVCDNNFG